MDDIVIYSREWKEHMDHLRQVLRMLNELNLKATSKKCNFGSHEVTYVGYTLSNKGIKPSARHTDGLLKYKKPINGKDLKSFIGLCNYFHKFVEGFSTKIRPLREVDLKLKKNDPVPWTTELEDCFENMKRVLLESTLVLPSEYPDFVLETDASDGAIGGVLIEIGKGVVAYLSRDLRGAELGYGASHKEALSIKWCMDQVRPLILGRKFKVKTDCIGWKWIQTKNSVKSERWRGELAEYDFEVEYVKGAENLAADALSRPPGMKGSADTFTGSNEPGTWSGDPKILNKLLKIKELHDYSHGSLTDLIRNARKEFPKLHRLEEICKLVMENCSCMKNGPHQEKKRTANAKTEKGVKPMDILHGDMKGPMKGNPKYLLTLKDTFSGYMMAEPMCSASATSVIAALTRIFTSQGVPRKIKFDNGTNFKAEDTQAFLRSRYVEIEYGCIENPCSNTVERSHRQWNSMADRNKTGSIDKILNTINDTPSRTRNNNTPASLFFGTDRNFHNKSSPYKDAEELDKRLERGVELVKSNIGPDEIAEIWIKDFGQRAKDKYKKLAGEVPEFLEELSEHYIIISDGNRGFRKIHRRNCKIVPKIRA